MSNQCLLSIVTIPAVEETLVDWLLGREELSGFSSHPIDGHGSRPSDLSLAEQVAGRQRKMLFTVHAECEQMRPLVDGLRQKFGGAGLHYWIVPLVEAGCID